MAWRTVGRLCVVVHSEVEPTDEEWDEYLAAMKRFPRVRDARVLVFSFGGGPTGLQRQKLQRQAGKSPAPVAILTAAGARMRGVGTALRWFNEEVAVFDESDFKVACEHLHLVQLEVLDAEVCLARLKEELEISQTGT